MSTVVGRLGWALRMRRRKSLGPYLRLLWHDFIVHALLNRGGERCEDCGRGYPLWHAPTDLYVAVHGNAGGLLCPSCFDRRAWAHGLSVEFIAQPFARDASLSDSTGLRGVGG